MVDNNALAHEGLVHTLFGAAAFQLLNAACDPGLFRMLQEKPGVIRAVR